MSAVNTKNPTLADIRLVTAQSTYFPEKKRQRIDQSIKAIWRYSGRRLETIPATVPAVREVIDSIVPAAHGVSRPTIMNVKNHVMHAMAQSGLVPAASGYMKPRKPLSPAWTAVVAQQRSHAERNALWSLTHFLNEQGVPPAQVDDSWFAAFEAYMAESSPRANQHHLIRQAATHWNAICARSPGLKLKELTVPPSRLRRRSIDASSFTQAFRDDRDNYLWWASNDDIFAENARPVVLKKATVANYKNRLDRCACILVESGVDVASITALADLVTVENFKTILRGVLAADTSSQRSETFGTAITLVRMAKDWVRPELDHMKELEKIKRKLPKPKMIMTEKNKLIVSQFDDPLVLERLAGAPNKMWARLAKGEKLGPRSRLGLAQGAIGLEVLLTMPLRLSNLTALSFGRHVILRPNGTSSIIIQAEDTKSGRAIEFDISSSLAEKLHEYYTQIVPSITGSQYPSLFCRTDGVGKGFAQVRNLIQTYFKEYVGFHMNPHAFRHLSAKIILDANPGAHVMVQELLGHKNLQTAVSYYAGLNSRRAGRHHHKLIAETIAREKQNTSPRRRSSKEK